MAKKNAGFSTGSVQTLLLSLLEEGDKYGYQMIEELRRRSDHTFDLKGGTLYPLLHSMEESGWITAYEQAAENGKQRKYYHITPEGLSALKGQKAEWFRYASAFSKILGGACYAG